VAAAPETVLNFGTGGVVSAPMLFCMFVTVVCSVSSFVFAVWDSLYALVALILDWRDSSSTVPAASLTAEMVLPLALFTAFNALEALVLAVSADNLALAALVAAEDEKVAAFAAFVFAELE